MFVRGLAALLLLACTAGAGTMVSVALLPSDFRVLHGPDDQLKAVNGKYYYDAYRLAAFYLAYLDAVWGRGGN